jgi:RND family efflux transporter MFP subunit
VRPLLLALLTAVLIPSAGCERPPPPVEDQSSRPAKLFRVTAEPATLQHQLIGRVEAAQMVDVSFQVAGELRELPIRQGQTLRAGELVAALDPVDFELAVQEATVQLRLARQDLERKEALLRDRGISQSVVDEARAQFDLAGIRLAQARKRQADARIDAPFPAYVTRRYVDNRTQVGAGEPIARLMDLAELKVVVSVPEELMATVDVHGHGIAGSARFDFLPGEEFPLRYLENIGEANPVAQTYDVAFVMPRPEQWNILPGMTAIVRLQHANGPARHVHVPASALQSDPAGGFYVWVFDPQTTSVSRRAVTAGAPLPQGIAIESGLSDGELVVTAGASQLQPAMRVHAFDGVRP